MSDVTRILSQIEAGDPQAAEKLLMDDLDEPDDSHHQQLANKGGDE